MCCVERLPHDACVLFVWFHTGLMIRMYQIKGAREAVGWGPGGDFLRDCILHNVCAASVQTRWHRACQGLLIASIGHLVAVVMAITWNCAKRHTDTQMDRTHSHSHVQYCPFVTCSIQIVCIMCLEAVINKRTNMDLNRLFLQRQMSN